MTGSADDARAETAYGRCVRTFRNQEAKVMSHARTVLIAAGLAFGVWETIDIFRIDVPAAAAIVAALFLSCTAWYWRRRSVRANVALLALFVLEVAAPMPSVCLP